MRLTEKTPKFFKLLQKYSIAVSSACASIFVLPIEFSEFQKILLSCFCFSGIVSAFICQLVSENKHEY